MKIVDFYEKKGVWIAEGEGRSYGLNWEHEFHSYFLELPSTNLYFVTFEYVKGLKRVILSEYKTLSFALTQHSYRKNLKHLISLEEQEKILQNYSEAKPL